MYTTEDAVALWQQVQSDIREHGPQIAYSNAMLKDEELLALTLTLAVSTTATL